MKKTLLTIFSFLLSISFAFSQGYIGSGNTQVAITTSSDQGSATGEKVLDGSGLNAHFYDAARFLQQATLAYDITDIIALSDGSYSTWIDDEILKTTTYMTPVHDAIYIEAENLFFANGGTGDYYGPAQKHFNYAWWQNTMTADDQLRQRVALALSEIFVISGQSDLREFGEGLSVFYDIMLEHAFGDFEDLLYDVSLNPCMAYYLTSLNNPKTNGNIRPDENYAREIMQLFSIGLYELNNDGSYELDGNGDEIPTYDQDDIREFAKVFTGLKGGDWDDESTNTGSPGFGTSIYSISKRVPCVIHAGQHEPGVKNLLNGASTNSDGITDIANAVNNLFLHDNVGPFISRRLIQRLVKSNPTPAYINRVANVFNSSPNGRGDLGAVVKAILMDPEARQASSQQSASAGMLKEPILKFSHVVSLLDKDNPSGNYWNNGYTYFDGVAQHPLYAPTVFNFFLPDYTPNNGLNGLYGPEFQIFNTRTSINWINFVHNWTVWGTLFWDWEGDYTDNVEVDYTDYTIRAAETEEFINYLDMRFTAGTLTDHTRAEIRTAMNGLGSNDYNRARMALTLVLSSPEFSVLH